MFTVDKETNQATLDSLRIVRRKLYVIPESELSAMSLEDQVKYGDNLHQNGLAILKLEAAKLTGVNDQFKAREEELEKATAGLEKHATTLTEAVEVVRVVNDGIKLITNIITLLV